MADNYNIYQQCSPCDGTGEINDMDAEGNPTKITCSSCNGTGEEFWGRMREEEEE